LRGSEQVRTAHASEIKHLEGEKVMTGRNPIAACMAIVLATIAPPNAAQQVEANRVTEVTLVSDKAYQDPFKNIELNALVTQPDRTQMRVPGFWAGGNRVAAPPANLENLH
jgi:hypothetical protein